MTMNMSINTNLTINLPIGHIEPNETLDCVWSIDFVDGGKEATFYHVSFLKLIVWSTKSCSTYY